MDGTEAAVRPVQARHQVRCLVRNVEQGLEGMVQLLLERGHDSERIWLRVVRRERTVTTASQQIRMDQVLACTEHKNGDA